jgi:type I restriction enzyme M protein
MTYLDNALKDGHAQFSDEGDAKKITYVAMNHTEKYADPEEKVRAEYWAELIYRYGYEPHRIGFEVTVPGWTPKEGADLVIFHDDARTRPYAVIEFRDDGHTDAVFDLAIERACDCGTSANFRANFVGVIAGQTRRFLDFAPRFGIRERESNIVADLPRQYGKPEEFRFWKGTEDDIFPVNKAVLISTFQKCHDTLWDGDKLSISEAFGELCKVIFVKISDERASRKNGEPYEFQTKTHEPNDQLYERIRSLYKEQQWRAPDVFANSLQIDAPTLRTIVSHIEGINFSKTDLDTKGVAFETFMGDFFKTSFGEYCTPREIIDFTVQMIQPQKNERVLDPACGSGGFLLNTLDYIRKEASDYHEEPVDYFKDWGDFAKKMLFGIEFNEDIARIAKMNMILHGDGHTNLIITDALQPLERIYERTGNNEFKKQSFDLILTTPPFGAMVALSQHPYLEDYKLWNQTSDASSKVPRNRQRSEILFIERIWDFLKPGTGRAAVIIPEGILTNSSLQEGRDFLLKRFQINAIVSLPQTAFAPFGTSVKTSIVFLRRRADGEHPSDNEPIFMAAPKLIGYDTTGTETKNQLPEVVRQYRAFEKNPEPFFVQLGITPPQKECLVYGVSLKEASDANQLSVDYFHPERTLAIESIRASKYAERAEQLKDIAHFHRDVEIVNNPKEYIGLANVQSNTGELIKATTAKVAGRCLRFYTGDILFAKLRPNLNKVYRAQHDGVCSTEFHVIRIQNVRNQEDSILPDYLAAFLRSSIVVAQTKHMMTGATFSRGDNDDVGNLLIPIPSLERQEKIVAELSRRYLKARRLREEAAKECEAAKAQFEAQLLSGEVS